MPTLTDDVVEDVLDDDAIEDVPESENKVDKKKPKRFSEENEHVFDDAPTALEALQNLKYDDGSKVDPAGFRVFGFAHDLPDQTIKDEKGIESVVDGELVRNDQRELTNATDFVIARNVDLAASYLMESQGWVGGLYKTRPRGAGAGRSKTNILSSMLDFGKLLAVQAYKECPMPEGGYQTLAGVSLDTDSLTVENETAHKNFQNWFAPGGNYGHYRDEEGNWKESNKDG